MKYIGTVEKHTQRGTALGYPTVNIALDPADVSGSFVACVSVDGKTYQAAAYADVERGVLEAHLLDFSGDLYEKEIAIDLLEKLREPARFVSDEDLKQAIAGDIARARAYFRDQ